MEPDPAVIRTRLWRSSSTDEGGKEPAQEEEEPHNQEGKEREAEQKGPVIGANLSDTGSERIVRPRLGSESKSPDERTDTSYTLATEEVPPPGLQLGQSVFMVTKEEVERIENLISELQLQVAEWKTRVAYVGPLVAGSASRSAASANPAATAQRQRREDRVNG